MLQLSLHLLRALFLTRHNLVLENLALRHQLQVLSRGGKRPHLRDRDRLLWIVLSRIWRSWRRPLLIVQRETVIRWHRAGYRNTGASKAGHAAAAVQSSRSTSAS